MGKPSATEVSIGNSLSNGLAPIVAIFAGAMTDRLGPRVVLMAAAVLTSLGSFACTFTHSIGVMVVLYSLPVCVGSACLSTPGGTAISSWLDKRLPLGMGIAYSGNGAGSSVIVPIAGVLASRYDWRTSFRIMAVFPGISFIAALFVYFRVKPEPRKPLSENERRFLKNLLTCRAFWILWISGALFSFAFFATLYVIVPFASSYGEAGTFYAGYTRIKTPEAATLFTWFGVFKWLGSVSLGAVAHRTEARLVYALSAGLLSVVIVLWPLCEGYGSLAVVASIVGFGFSGMFATLPSMTAQCFAGKFAGLAIGATMSAFAVGGFAGPPVILALKESQGGSYTLSFAVMAATIAVSGLICFIAGQSILVHQPFAIDDDDGDATESLDRNAQIADTV